jgi:hypothetical protein
MLILDSVEPRARPEDVEDQLGFAEDHLGAIEDHPRVVNAHLGSVDLPLKM